ncbi:hypothetical protein JAAARDRAFT_128524 [Jaapia argillacea MUCL 33604]|uniref:NADH:flavin oxidoreductase/NADH oxidase N-terminal domain-containing protein n=1 Tax=Jaapia argillacea MUCL 33604 TaxID=933084 RepID=A0A067PWW2_9AGAM|nr:hypothetical protein JAAARDRAFT_128524 [Jaapia argillacea MUCL 33604]
MPTPKLFQPIKIRGVEFHNRIFASPMCQYSANHGKLTATHISHRKGIINQGPGLSFVEATAVLPEGRSTLEDAGLWDDNQVDPLKEIVDFAHTQHQKIGIQLAYAGHTVAKGPFPFSDASFAAQPTPNGVGQGSYNGFKNPIQPTTLQKEDIKIIVAAFASAAARAVEAGFDVIEINSAHGYIFSSFLTPFINGRTDEYGGSFENRIRFTLEVVDAVRSVIPAAMPLFLRVSASDWQEDVLPAGASWTIDDTVKLAAILPVHNVDLIDISNGGSNNDRDRSSPLASRVDHYQASAAMKKAVDSQIVVGSVGGYEDGKAAEMALEQDKVDVIFIGRGFQKNPGLILSMAAGLGVAINGGQQGHGIEDGTLQAKTEGNSEGGAVVTAQPVEAGKERLLPTMPNGMAKASVLDGNSRAIVAVA